MKSAGNRGVVQSRLQVLLRVHFLLPHGAQPRWRSLARPCIRASLPSGNGPQHGSAGELTVRRRSAAIISSGCASSACQKRRVSVLNAVLGSSAASFQFHRFTAMTAFAFSRDAFLCSLVDRLEHFCHNFDFDLGTNRENIGSRNANVQRWYLASGNTHHGLQHPHALVTDDELTPSGRYPRPLKKLTSWPCPLRMPRQRLKNLTKPSHSRQSPPKQKHFRTLRPVAAQVDAVHVDVWIPSALADGFCQSSMWT